MREAHEAARLHHACWWRDGCLAAPARAQQGAMKRVGVLMAFDEHDARARGWLSSFTQGLSELGWAEGRNLQTEVRWAGHNVDRMRMFAKELVALRPDVILSLGTPVTAALQRETRTIPIVFAIVSDPVGEGSSRARPIRAAISLAFTIQRCRSEASGWNSSSRSRRDLSVPP